MRKRTEINPVKGVMCVLVVPLISQQCNGIIIWSHDIFGSGVWLKVPIDHKQFVFFSVNAICPLFEVTVFIPNPQAYV